MSSKSSNKTESRAITFLRIMLDDIENVDYDIQEKDKKATWDGTINLYHGNIDNKDNLDYIADIQLKGRRVKKNKIDKYIKFPIDRRDLENYLKKDGTLFFLVTIDDTGSKKLYAKSLQRYELNSLLKKFPKDEEIKVKLQEIKNHNHLESECRTFCLNREEQKKISEKVLNSKGFIPDDNYRMITWNYDNPIEMIGSNQYIYKYDDNDNIIEIQSITLTELCKERNIKISSKDKKVEYNKLKYIKNEHEEYFVLGKSFKLSINLKNKENDKVNLDGKFDIKISGTYKERIKDILFLEKIIKDNCFLLENEIVKINLNKKVKERLNKEIKFHKRIQKFIKNSNIEKDFNMSKWEKEEFKNFDYLMLSMVDGASLIMSEHPKSQMFIGIYDINELKIAYIARADKNGYYIFEDIWNNNTKEVFTYEDEKGRHQTQNKYLFFNKEIYLADNINLKNAADYFEKKGVEEGVDLIINQVLNAISAYDECKNEDLLEYSLFLLDLLDGNREIETIIFINRCQIFKRQDKLSKENIEELLQIKKEEKDLSIQYACNLLLDSKLEADIIYDKLSQDEKVVIDNFPISIFANHKKES